MKLPDGKQLIGFLIGAGVTFAALYFTGIVDLGAAQSLGDRIKGKIKL